MAIISLGERLKSSSTVDLASVMAKSSLFGDVSFSTTMSPILNIALSAKVDGGITSGLTVMAGPSKNFKTGLSLLCGKAYLDKYKDAFILFYDSEFGAPQSYFESFGIDLSRVFHTPITDIEQLKFDLMAQISNLKRGDHVIIIVDSVGNLASKKETEDALNQKSVADMTRAKALKSMFRLITPHLKLLDIPMVAISHSYETMEMFSREVVSGGRGIYYSADTVILAGRRQVKDSSGVTGYNFVLNIDKSRFVREKSQLFLSVDFEKGVSRYSGLLELALEAKYVTKPSAGWYQRVDPDTGEVIGGKLRLADLNGEFWEPILEDEEFRNWVYARYAVSTSSPLSDEAIDSDMDSMKEEE